jgi:hypothetical protein
MRLLALPFPVARIFSLPRWIADHGRPASSQARTAAPSIAKRALTPQNCPVNGSSMPTPVHSGPALRVTMLRTPAVRLTMLPSSRIVWASKPPSMNTLLTPGVVPKSKPKTNLRLNH